MSASVLVTTPTWVQEDGNNAIRPETLASIWEQDNQEEFVWIATVHNPYPAPDSRNVLAQYQSIRETFLQGDWLSLVLLEHDNVLPDSGALQRMMDTPAEVVYTPYVFRHGGGLSTWQYVNDVNLGMPLTQHPVELEQARKAGVWRVSGAGFGCTLIRRRVVELIPFRQDSGGQAPDIPFAEDCLRAGIVPMANMTVAVGHFTDEGVLLEPYWKEEVAMYQALETVNVMTAGRFIALKTGLRYDLTQQEADDLSRAGYVRKVDDGPSGSSNKDLPAPDHAGAVLRKPSAAKRS